MIANFDSAEEFYLKNIGKRDGAETVQIYISNPSAIISRPIKELRAFEKVMLKSAEKRKISIDISISDLGYYNVSLHRYVTEAGRYDVYIGASSQDIRLEATVLYTADMPYSLQQQGESMIG